MPSLIIPESGLTLGGTSSKNGSFSTEMLGLTLADSVIEEMIRCVQNRKPIQLSLGDNPSISYGSKTQHLSSSDDPFTTDLFSSNLSSMAPSNKSKKESAMYTMFGMIPKRLVPAAHPPTKTHTKTPSTPNISETAGTDAALAALQNSLASENAKKAENSIKYIKDGSLTMGKKGGKQTSKTKFLSQNRLLHDTTRSMPSSPALSGVGSPALGPTSAPLSQQQAEQAKADRKPVIHLLAVQPRTEISLREEIPEASNEELKEALQKVGHLNEATGKWELKNKNYRELDVWNFQFSQVNDRQKAIDNAVKVFDKMRLSPSEPEWERLLPKNERGTGKCLSKVQAKIAAGPPPKSNASKATDSGRDTPNGEEEDSVGDKHVSKSKGGETMARSTSQPLANKPKKTSEKEAQAKRLLSKKPAVPKPVTKSAPAVKKAPVPKAGTKVLSSEYVHDSDEDDSPPPAKPLPKVTQKRARPDDDADSSDSSIPLSKKVKKDTPLSHRVSDASQASRTTTNSSNYTATSSKMKSNSPQKSSPLASSPPTNASDFEDQSSGERTSSSASPPHVSTKNSRSPIHKRHGKTSSVSSSNSSSSRYLKQEVTDLARRYRLYYPKYEALHRELSGMNGQRDKQKERNLLEMHARLEAMKKEILAGIVDGDSS